MSNQNYKYVCIFDNAEQLYDKKFLAWGDMDSGKYWSAYTDEDVSTLEYGIDEIVLYQYSSATRRIRFVKNGAKVELYYYSTTSSLPYYFDAKIRFA